MSTRDTSTIVLFDVDGTLTPARKVRLRDGTAIALAAARCPLLLLRSLQP